MATNKDRHPYGAGSHGLLTNEREMPACHPIKGNVRNDGSKRYHRPDSRNYAATVAEVWFDSPSAAEAAGFELAPTHPRKSSGADFEPGATEHPCSAEQVMENRRAAGGALGQVDTAGTGTAAGVVLGAEAIDADLYPCGIGSHGLLADALAMPGCYPIKGNVRNDGSKLYHRTDSRSYGATIPDVWFDSPAAAEAAGFGLAPTHPRGASAGDFEPGGSEHPCSAEMVRSNRSAAAGLTGAGTGGRGSDPAGGTGASTGAMGIAGVAGAGSGSDGGADAVGDEQSSGIGKTAALGAIGAAGAAAVAGAALADDDDVATVSDADLDAAGADVGSDSASGDAAGTAAVGSDDDATDRTSSGIGGKAAAAGAIGAAGAAAVAGAAGAAGGAGGAGDAAKGVAGRAGDPVRGAAGRSGDAAGKAGDKAGEAAKGAADKASGATAGAGGAAKGAADKAGGAATDVGGKAGGAAKDVGGKAGGAAKGAADKGGDSVGRLTGRARSGAAGLPDDADADADANADDDSGSGSGGKAAAAGAVAAAGLAAAGAAGSGTDEGAETEGVAVGAGAAAGRAGAGSASSAGASGSAGKAGGASGAAGPAVGEVHRGSFGGGGSDGGVGGFGRWLWMGLILLAVVLLLGWLLSRCGGDDGTTAIGDDTGQVDPAGPAAGDGEDGDGSGGTDAQGTTTDAQTTSTEAEATTTAAETTTTESETTTTTEPEAPADLQALALAALVEAGYDEVEVEVDRDGETVRLVGNVGTDADKAGAEAALDGIEGLSTVNNQLVVSGEESNETPTAEATDGDPDYTG